MSEKLIVLTPGYVRLPIRGNNHFSEDFANVRNEWSLMSFTPVDTGRKLNVHKTFRRCQNVLFTCNLRPVSTGTFNVFPIYVK